MTNRYPSNLLHIVNVFYIYKGNLDLSSLLKMVRMPNVDIAVVKILLLLF